MTCSHQPIAVIGVSGVLPGAHSVDQYFRNLLQQRCFIRDIPPWLWDQDLFFNTDKDAPNSSYAAIAALIEDPDMDLSDFRIPPSVAQMMSRSQKLSLICAQTALLDAGLLNNPTVNRDRVGVIMAAISGGEINMSIGESLSQNLIFNRLKKLGADMGISTAVRDLINAYEEKHEQLLVNADTLPGASPNLIAGRIASVFDFHGLNLTLDAACASSLAALGTAVSSLQTGESDIVVAGGVDTWIDIGAFIGFSKITALSRTGCFPFDERADGLALGEGCGVVVLKRLEDAQSDGNKIYAVIRGVGNSSDGSGQGITVPTSEGQSLAMRRAYEQANIDPATLDYIESHGTGTRIGDPIELESMQQLLKSAPTKRQSKLPVGSVKASVGHMRTAAGIAGFLNAINVIQHRTIPPQINFEQATSNFDWENSDLRVPLKSERLHGNELRVGVSAYGFGGINYHLVVTSPPSNPKPPRFDASQHVLAETPKIQGDVAFLFPGQGSQYIDMLADVSETEIGQRFLMQADSIVQEITGRTLSSVIYPDEKSDSSDATLQATEMAQPAILTFSAILLEMVREQGISCAMAIGHSLGEYSALYACGVLSFEDALRAVTLRGQLMNQDIPGDEASSMASLLGSTEDIDALLETHSKQIVRANLNSYEQVVVAGPCIAIQQLIKDAQTKGLRANWLNVDRAFHSPFVSHAVAPMREILSGFELHQTSIPIPANISRQMYPYSLELEENGQPMNDAARQQVIDLLTRQIDQPVDFIAQVELAYRAGIRRFVEIGPRRILSGLVRSMLQGKYHQVIALDEPQNSPLNQIKTLRHTLSEPVAIHRRPLSNLQQPQIITAPAQIQNMANLPLEDCVRTVIAAVSGYSSDQIGNDVDFEHELGLDSLKLIEITLVLRKHRLLAENYRGFRKLTSINRIIAEIREHPVDNDTNDIASSFNCYINQERPSTDVNNENNLSCSSWYVDAPKETQQALTELKQKNKPGSQILVLRSVSDSLTLCNETLPDLLEAVVNIGNNSGNETMPNRFALITYGDKTSEVNRWFRALSGFIRSVALELPDVIFSYHHIDSLAINPDQLQLCLADSAIGRRLNKNNVFLEATLEPLQNLSNENNVASLAKQLGTDDILLVTGGARGIASCIVRSLLRHTSARFLLIGQKPETEDWILEEGDGRVEYVAADIADPQAVRKLRLADRGITLLLHAAGLSPLTPLQQKTQQEFKRVVNVKAMGLENIVANLNTERLRGIINFSSIVAHFGNLAQADYAAANGFLDGYSIKNVPVLSIGWTAWGEVGMASHGLVRSVMETSGIALLPTKEGVRIFEQLLSWWFNHSDKPSINIEVFGDLGVSLAKQNAPDIPLHDKALTQNASSPVNHEQSNENIITLNPGGRCTPLFMICGIFGHAYRLLLLAKEAPESSTFLALQPPNKEWP